MYIITHLLHHSHKYVNKNEFVPNLRKILWLLIILCNYIWWFILLFQDQFYEYMFQQASKTDNKTLLENKGVFVLVHASSGFKHALKGMLYIFN